MNSCNATAYARPNLCGRDVDDGEDVGIYVDDVGADVGDDVGDDVDDDVGDDVGDDAGVHVGVHVVSIW